MPERELTLDWKPPPEARAVSKRHRSYFGLRERVLRKVRWEGRSGRLLSRRAMRRFRGSIHGPRRRDLESARNPQVAEAALRPRTSVFIHGDLQIVHVLDDGDGASGAGDWSEGGQGDAMYDLATLTLAHEEHLDDVMAGYGGHIEIDVIRANWSLRSLMEIRWLVSTATARRRRSQRSRC